MLKNYLGNGRPHSFVNVHYRVHALGKSRIAGTLPLPVDAIIFFEKISRICQVPGHQGASSGDAKEDAPASRGKTYLALL